MSFIIMIAIYIVAFLIHGTIWGFCVDKVIENKGYDENWFLWGFFLGPIGYLVAVTKPANMDMYLDEEEKNLRKLVSYKKLYDEGIISEKDFLKAKKTLMKDFEI